MAKDKSKKNSEISDSGVLSMDMEDFQTAVERSAWKNTGGGIPDVGDYQMKITKITRGESKGSNTTGAANYRTEGEIVGGPFAGSKLNVFTIAHGSTMQRYLRFLEAVAGVAAADIPSVNGRPQIPVLTQDAVEKFVGKVVPVNVQHRDRQDKPGTKGTEVDFIVADGAEAGEGKKAKKDKSKIAE